MKNPFRSLLNAMDAWAAQRVVRIALFGHGIAMAEWESLQTTPYLRSRPQVQIVTHPSDAEVLAIHGPFNEMNWSALENWISLARSGATVVAVGSEFSLTADGHVIGPHNVESTFRISYCVPGHPPRPKDLHETIVCLMGARRV